MSAFEQLHPSIQHHVVNTLGWNSLRPLQEDAIVPLLAGRHALLLAPTAGGKTEASMFPLYTRMMNEGWTGLSILYVCPLKALLNALHIRLAHYGRLFGRSCAVWHGDTGPSERRRILADPPDVLLITPESLEVILTSPHRDGHGLLSDLRAVVVDEIHAFAGDDRGWHLLSVIGRISRIARRELQRVGLSATVGKEQDLLAWLTTGCSGGGDVIAPPAGAAGTIDLRLDYVGSLENAAVVISRLHRGEKRLVFCEGRSGVEQLSFQLRQNEITTHVSHGSLGKDERLRAERAFAEATDCVIVSTSTLELGIDVGDLDRVILIDGPSTVASFLQRIGRAGRRASTTRNGLFLTLSPQSTLRAAAIGDLALQGWIDPMEPPAAPFHVVAQQIMALALQERGIGRTDCRQWLEAFLRGSGVSDDDLTEILAHMVSTGVLSEDQNLLWLGRHGEDQYGFRYFMELFSVFTSDPLFSVRHGQEILGEVDPSSFLAKDGQQPVLLMGGRGWRVKEIEWSRKVAWVEPVPDSGRSRWSSPGRHLGFRLCRTMRHILATDSVPDWWSARAITTIGALRAEFAWLTEGGTQVVQRPGGDTTWWTFAGYRANAALGDHLGSLGGSSARYDNLSITFGSSVSAARIVDGIQELRSRGTRMAPDVALDDAIRGLKFADCLPVQMAAEELRRRLEDREAVGQVMGEAVGEVAVQG
jgi:ATP-dependent Lhr-like helicase